MGSPAKCGKDMQGRGELKAVSLKIRLGEDRVQRGFPWEKKIWPVNEHHRKRVFVGKGIKMLRNGSYGDGEERSGKNIMVKKYLPGPWTLFCRTTGGSLIEGGGRGSMHILHLGNFPISFGRTLVMVKSGVL